MDDAVSHPFRYVLRGRDWRILVKRQEGTYFGGYGAGGYFHYAVGKQ